MSTTPEDAKLRTAIAQFGAVMGQSPYAGPDRDAIDIQMRELDESGAQHIRVTYTTTSVIGSIDRSTGESVVRTGESVKVDATIRLIPPTAADAAVQMEIDGQTEPFDPTTARKKLERILSAKAGAVLRAAARPNG